MESRQLIHIRSIVPNLAPKSNEAYCLAAPTHPETSAFPTATASPVHPAPSSILAILSHLDTSLPSTPMDVQLKVPWQRPLQDIGLRCYPVGLPPTCNSFRQHRKKSSPSPSSARKRNCCRTASSRSEQHQNTHDIDWRGQFTPRNLPRSTRALHVAFEES